MDNNIEDIIIRLFSDEISEEEQTTLLSWLDLSEDNRKKFDDMKEIWLSSTTKQELKKYDAESAFHRFLQKTSSEDEPHTAHHFTIFKWVAGIAASVLVVFFSTYYSYNKGQKDITNTFTDIVITSPEGSHTKIQLPDGTSVTLNSSSKLAYSQGFGVNDRNVFISGEGYFEVKKDAAKPFTVNSDNISVKVLGTKFNFCDYSNDNVASVTLDEGAVSMSDLPSKKQQVKLTQNQCAVFNKKSGKIEITPSDPILSHIWTESTLSFNGESLGRITQILERSYDVNISFRNKQKQDLHFYGTFYRNNQSIRDIMEAFATTGNIKYTIKGKKITIY